MTATRTSTRRFPTWLGVIFVLGLAPAAALAQGDPSQPRQTPKSLLETPTESLLKESTETTTETQPGSRPEEKLGAPADSAALADPAGKRPPPAAGANGADEESGEKKKPGTTITAEKEATFDNEERKATFAGNVKVSDPEFNLTCDKLNVFLAGSKEAEGKPAGESSSSLRKAIAEGNVEVVQRRTGDDGVEKLYRGNAENGVYDATTGEFALTGWPKVQQGINSHIGTERSTVIVITKEGKMKTQGPSRTVIEETPDEP